MSFLRSLEAQGRCPRAQRCASSPRGLGVLVPALSLVVASFLGALRARVLGSFNQTFTSLGWRGAVWPWDAADPKNQSFRGPPHPRRGLFCGLMSGWDELQRLGLVSFLGMFGELGAPRGVVAPSCSVWL